MVVLPGDKVAALEEYIPSYGVYAEDDDVYSASTGDLELDKGKHLAMVKARTRVPKMQGVGLKVVGIAANVTDNFAMIDLIKIESDHFTFVPNEASAILRVDDVRKTYSKSMRDEIRTGDIIRAKIVNVEPHTVALTTVFSELGVIKAFCSNCRKPLVKKDRKLVCEECGTSETRKTADDYGSGNLL